MDTAEAGPTIPYVIKAAITQGTLGRFSVVWNDIAAQHLAEPIAL
jgi:hypothetical protein